ncbi:MAG: hypothetical protein KBC60_13485 [Haliscomenobacter sp.]|nr:hypothetical protein [Haliscomenobacter sp.]
MIPVFAFGPGSELFSGIYENTEIYHKIRWAFGFGVQPAQTSLSTSSTGPAANPEKIPQGGSN